MAKLSREKLKTIVKECLVEILSEGLSTPDNRLTESSTRHKTKQKHVNLRPALDNISFGQKVQQTVGNLSNDPLMASIFADTAVGTLQEQIGAESRGAVAQQGDSASRAMSESEPNDMFGEAAANWAALAFTEKKTR